MSSLVIFLTILGVFLTLARGGEEECPGNGDNAVDWTKKTQIWYYCQTSIPNRKSNNCYVTFTTIGKGETEAVVHSYDLTSKAEGSDKFRMKHIDNGKYSYLERGTTAMNMKVTPDGKCLTYWKCHDDAGNWNGVPGSGAYFMYMCIDQALCKPQDQYKGEYKKIFDQAKNEKKIDIFDLDQAECTKQGIKP